MSLLREGSAGEVRVLAELVEVLQGRPASLLSPTAFVTPSPAG